MTTSRASKTASGLTGLVALFLLAYVGLGIGLIAKATHPESHLIDGVLGNGHLLGTSESTERGSVLLLWAGAVILFALLVEIRRFSRNPLYRRLGNLALGTLGVLGILASPPGALDHFLILGVLCFLPWGELASLDFARRVARAFRRPPFRAAPIVAGLGIALSFRLALFSPWETTPSPWGRLDLGITVGIFLFAVAMVASLRRDSQVLYALALSPLVAVGRLVSFAIAISLRPETAVSILTAQGEAIALAGAGIIGGLLWVGCRRSSPGARTSLAVRWVGLPSLLYVALLTLNLKGAMNGSEGDLFQGAEALLSGRHPYRDIFLPHGLGISLLGAGGQMLWGNTLAAFRLGYGLLTGLVWVLLYFFFAVWFRRARSGTLVLLTLVAGSLQTLALPYPVGWVTWHGGIKLLVPLMALIAAAAILRRSALERPSRSTFFCQIFLLGSLSALALFMNLEHGVATTGALSIVVIYLAIDRRDPVFETALAGIGFVASAAAVSLALWTRFVFLSDLLPGLRYHLFTFTAYHAQKLGLPLFASSTRGLQILPFPASEFLPAFHPYALYPLVLIPLAAGVVYEAWRRRRFTADQAMITALVVFSTAIYQISINRSEVVHFRVGLGLTGILGLLLLREKQGMRGLTLFLTIAFFLGTALSPTELIKNTFRKRQPALDSVPLVSFSPEREGRHPALSPDSRLMLGKASQFLARHPQLGSRAFFFTEDGFLFKIFLKLQDVTPWTMHHYIFSSDQQREVIRQIAARDARMIFFDEKPKVMPYASPRYWGWPILSDYIHRNFYPCEALGDSAVILVRNDLRKICRDIGPKAWERSFPSMTDVGSLPELLARERARGTLFPEGSFFGVHFPIPTSSEKAVVLRWHCHRVSYDDDKGVAFRLVPGASDYLIPMSANPAWAYCPGKSLRLFESQSSRQAESELREARLQWLLRGASNDLS